MATEKFANNPTTTLSATITAGQTTLAVASAALFPATVQYRIIIDSEIMLVTAGAGSTTWTATRGAEGTTATSHASGAVVAHVITRDSLANLPGPMTTQYDLWSLDATGQAVRATLVAGGNITITPAAGPPATFTFAATALPVPDTTAVVMGSADNTKQLRFEVDGFTTGTTRVLTPPDQDGTLAVLERAQTFTLTQTFSASPTAPKGTNGERFGTGALATCTGSRNTGFGYQALAGVVAGIDNTAVGSSALATCTGDENTAIGSGALLNNTTGARNVAIGVSALAANLTGEDNMAVGRSALSSNASGHGNVAMGRGALTSMTGFGVDYNVGVGTYALYYVTFGSSNVGIGANSGGAAVTLTTGSFNVLLGDRATTTAVDSNYAIALGYKAQAATNEAAFGPHINDLSLSVFSSTGTLRPRVVFRAANVDNTDATRKYRLIQSVYDTAEREGYRVETDGSGANFSFFGSGSWGSGRNVLFIPNAAIVPSSNPTGGGILYVEGGALKYRGSSGTVTTIAPA